jgi:hypothetical protein
LPFNVYDWIPVIKQLFRVNVYNAAIDKAIRLDPEHPRSYDLQAVILLNMPVLPGREKFQNRLPYSVILKSKFLEIIN